MGFTKQIYLDVDTANICDKLFNQDKKNFSSWVQEKLKEEHNKICDLEFLKGEEIRVEKEIEEKKTELEYFRDRISYVQELENKKKQIEVENQKEEEKKAKTDKELSLISLQASIIAFCNNISQRDALKLAKDYESRDRSKNVGFKNWLMTKRSDVLSSIDYNKKRQIQEGLEEKYHQRNKKEII